MTRLRYAGAWCGLGSLRRLALLFAAALPTAPLVQAQPGTVKAYQKISSTEGGFSGILNDRDDSGSSIASLGYLDSDGAIDLTVRAPTDEQSAASSPSPPHWLFANR